jgi:hypothetical protein
MTPNERLDQLEPLVADALQKIDRLIEGQGKIIDLATKTEQQVNKIGQQVSTTAQAVAKLTVSTQQQYEDLKVGQEAIMQYLREKLP